jgi:hypothetical protein
MKDRRNKWRKEHTTFRNKCRKRNYAKSRPIIINGHWENYELELIVFTHHPYTDHQLSMLLTRSVQAIQQKRYLLKKENP